jgi:tetratricopeptide (TPR) repeat protein
MTEDELKLIWMKQARLMNSMSNWQDCKLALEKVKSLEKVDEEWIFLMGLVSYRLSNYAEARKYFDWIVKKYPEDVPQASFTPFVEKARLFLSYLNSKTSKKALFKVIPGKK